MKRRKKCNGSTEGEELRKKRERKRKQKVKPFSNCWGGQEPIICFLVCLPWRQSSSRAAIPQKKPPDTNSYLKGGVSSSNMRHGMRHSQHCSPTEHHTLSRESASKAGRSLRQGRAFLTPNRGLTVNTALGCTKVWAAQWEQGGCRKALGEK